MKRFILFLFIGIVLMPSCTSRSSKRPVLVYKKLENVENYVLSTNELVVLTKNTEHLFIYKNVQRVYFIDDGSVIEVYYHVY